MKVILEEIKHRHPRATSTKFCREEIGVHEMDPALLNLEADDGHLWLDHPERRLVIVLYQREIALPQKSYPSRVIEPASIGLLIDIASEEIYGKIAQWTVAQGFAKMAANGYEQWAKEHEVWP